MIDVTNISLHFTRRTLFDEITFRINDRDKIGLVGRNGAGKSTLLKAIFGSQKLDGGNISMSKETTIGYLPQELKINSKLSVYEETKTAFKRIQQVEAEIEEINQSLQERSDYESESYLELINDLNDKQHQMQVLGGYTMEEDIEKVLKGLGFEHEDMEVLVMELSGGWQMRVELAKLLLQHPSLLLLDEPTNHLDIESITWLEDFLKDYEGAIMLVSHDRTFLDAITNRTIEVTLGAIEDYKTHYSKYVELRKERKEKQIATKKNQDRELEQLQRNIDRFRYKASKAKFAQSLIKKMDKIERIEVDDEDRSAMRIRFPEAKRSGEIVVTGKNLHKSYGENHVIKGLDFEIERDERVAFVGKNGMGKTTLSRMIVGEIDFEGRLKLGHNVQMGYYAQHQATGLHENNSILEEMEEAARNEMQSKVRSLLGAFLFSGEDVHKKIKVLSGGEKSRLALAKLLLEPTNFLVLDEPTNHLDMIAKDVLKEALKNFKGTLVVVSHDRDFLSGLTDKLFEFTAEGIKPHIGTVDSFLEKKKLASFRALELEKEKQESEKKKAASNGNSLNKNRYKLKKQLEKDIRRLKNSIGKCEKKINELDQKIHAIDEQLRDPEQYNELIKDQTFFGKYEALKEQQDKVTQQWEEEVESLSSFEKELAAIAT